MKLTNEQIDQLVDELQGTIGSFDNAVKQLFDIDDWMKIDTESLVKFDEMLFGCCGCGWWYSTDEQNDIDGEFFCNDCASDIFNEDEF